MGMDSSMNSPMETNQINKSSESFYIWVYPNQSKNNCIILIGVSDLSFITCKSVDPNH